MHAYEKLFGACGVKIAQVLLTEEDFTDRRRYSNLQRTMEKLLKFGVVPVVNENDTVSTAELEYLEEGAGRVFSDNDRLAALVMSKLQSDVLVVLTNVDGLLKPTSGDEGLNAGEATVIPLVTEITPELKSLASGTSLTGRGGMTTKLEAAEIAMRAGGLAVIANGKNPDTLRRIFDGDEVGTAFVPTSRMAGKRRWIAYAAGIRGRVVVNAGARRAILQTKASLLTSGVVAIEREFDAMDVLSIVDEEGSEFARGIANCGSSETLKSLDQRGNMPATTVERSSKSSILVTRNNIVILGDFGF
jgi:glutamate 5-kinase